jgi:hypothetical protein
MAGPTRHSTTELHRATDDTTGDPIDAGFLVAADGAGLLEFIDPATIIPTGDFLTKNEGGQDFIEAHGSMGSTETFDPTDGNVHTGTLTADCTFTINAPVGSGAATLEFWITQDGTGGWDITWPGSVTWDGGTPTPDTTAGVTVRYILESLDGGSNWIGNMVGGGGGGTPATTVTDETTWGITPAVGTDTEYARQDHTHGTPDEPTDGGGGPILITDTPAGSPLVFADLLQTEDGTDLLYADSW